MLTVLRALLTYWRRHLLQLALALLGVALGVAAVTAIDLANTSALASFRESIHAVTGRATHQIVPAAGIQSGIDENIFAKVARIPGVIAAAPVIESHGMILPRADFELGSTPSEERASEALHPENAPAVVRILGIEPLLDRDFRPAEGALSAFRQKNFEDWVVRDDGCVLPATLANNLRLAPGSRLTVLSSGRRHELKLIATYVPRDEVGRSSSDVLLMDIAAAQERFGQIGRISTIDLILPEGEGGEQCAARIRQMLPDDAALQRPAERAGRTEALLAAFQLNLRALALLALTVGIFLVNNTLTVAVLQRVPLIGTLRCLGASSRNVQRAILCEAILFGTAGTLLGLLAGTALAEVFLARVGGTVLDLYAHIGSLSIFYDTMSILKGLALGILASVIGAYLPAREAASVKPAQILRRSHAERRAQGAWKILAALGVGGCALAAVLALTPGSSPVPGLAAAFFLALGGALCAPAVTQFFSKFSHGMFRRIAGTLGHLSARGISANLSRTGLAVGALSLALSMTLGVAMMVASFRGTLNRWMDQSLHADLFLRPAGPALLRHVSFMPDDVLAKLQMHPAVEAVDTYRGRDVVLADGAPVLVIATDSSVTYNRGRERFPLMEGSPDISFPALLKGEVLISETLARKQKLHAGDAIQVPPSHEPLKIAGVYYDYATDRGVVSMDVSTWEKLFHDSRANSASIYLKPGADLEQVRTELRGSVGAPNGLYIFSNRTLREEALRVFDRTFAITGQLENLSLAVGLCGIVSALLALLRERSTEFALLRALGMSSRGLFAMLLLEGILLGLIAFLVSCVLGPLLALLLIHVINLRAFGWTILFSWHAEVFLRVGLLTIVMSALASLYPSLRARRMNISAALREE